MLETHSCCITTILGCVWGGCGVSWCTNYRIVTALNLYICRDYMYLPFKTVSFKIQYLPFQSFNDPLQAAIYISLYRCTNWQFVDSQDSILQEPINGLCHVILIKGHSDLDSGHDTPSSQVALTVWWTLPVYIVYQKYTRHPYLLAR